MKQECLEALVARIAPEREAFIQDMTSLCSIPSVRGKATEDAPYGVETVRALHAFFEIAERLGFRTQNLDNRAGYAEFGSGDKMIAGLCHLDVVPAGEGWSHDPFKPRVEGNRFIARGSSDDKGPAIAVLYAMKLLRDSGYEPPCRIRLIVGLDEESGMSCMKHYREVEEIPVAGFTSDADFPAIYAEKGMFRLTFEAARQVPEEGEVLWSMQAGEAPNMVPQTCTWQLARNLVPGETQTVSGQSAHASRPETGKNSITEAFKLIRAELPGCRDPLLDFAERLMAGRTDGSGLGIAFEDESGALTLNLGLIHVTPEHVSLTFDIRYPITQDPQTILRSIDGHMATVGMQRTDTEHSIPLDLGKDSVMVRTVMDVYNRLMDADEEAIAIGGGTYARTIPNILAFGPAFPGDPEVAHQVDEYINLDHYLAAAVIYCDTFKALAENLRQ